MHFLTTSLYITKLAIPHIGPLTLFHIQVSRRFSELIRTSLLLQFRLELCHGALNEHFQPISILTNPKTTVQRLDALRKQQFGWRNLAWRARQVVALDHPKGALYDLSNGIFISGNKRRLGIARANRLVLQELPGLEPVDEPAKKTEIECEVGVSQLCFDIEQDLLVLLEEGGNRGVS